MAYYSKQIIKNDDDTQRYEYVNKHPEDLWQKHNQHAE